MVEVIVPLRRQPVAAVLARRDQPRVVEVGLGHQDERPARQGRERVHLDREFLKQVQGATVLERVHRVEPQPVDVVVAQPHQHVADHEGANFVGARLVQVHRRAPRRHVRGGEVRPEVREPVAGTDVVVHHVEENRQATAVTGVHEPLQRVRAAVRLVHGP